MEDIDSVTDRNDFDQILKEVTEKNKRIKEYEDTNNELFEEIKKQNDTIAKLTAKLQEKDKELQLKTTELAKKVQDEQKLKEKFRNIARKSADDSDDYESDESSKETSRKRRKTSHCKIDTTQQHAANVAQNEELKRTVADLQFKLKRAHAANQSNTPTAEKEPCNCSEELNKHKQFLSQLTKNYNTARDCVIHYKKKAEQLQTDLDNADIYWSAMITKMIKMCKCKKTPVIPRRH